MSEGNLHEDAAMRTMAAAQAGAPAAAGKRVSALCAALLGLALLYGVGFAGPAALHEAAHDSRHGLAFPCH